MSDRAPIEHALERTLAIVTRALGFTSAWIWLLDGETRRFYHAASLNLPPYLQSPEHMRGKTCWCIEGFFEGLFVSENIDVMECSRLRSGAKLGGTKLTQGMRYHASVALSFGERQLGIMNVTGPKWRKLTTAELRLLSTVGYQVGVAIERAKLAETAVLSARADERAAIAREIHDTLAQDLTAIALHLESAEQNLDRDRARTHERITNAIAIARKSLETARGSVLALRADPARTKPLRIALAAMAREFASQTGVRVSYEPSGEPALAPDAEREFVRIAGEALSNVRKHAHAAQVALRLRATRSRTSLTIEDDGVGIGTRERSGHFGILGMHERASAIGATLRIGRRRPKGTRVSVMLHHAVDAK